MDPGLRARQLSKAKQILIDFAHIPEKEKMRNTSLTTLLDDANKSLKEAIPSTTAMVVNAAKLTHGGLLLELNSHNAINQLNQDGIKEAFLVGLGPLAYMRPRQYNAIVYFIPLTIDIDTPDGLRDQERQRTDNSLHHLRKVDKTPQPLRPEPAICACCFLFP